MLDINGPQREALEALHVKRRLFVWIEATELNGTPDPIGFWDDLGDISHLGRTYRGGGNLVEISSVSGRGDLTIPAVTIRISGIQIESELLVRAHSISQVPVFISIGLFNITTRQFIPPLIPYFEGRIDDVKITIPEAGGEGTIDLTCESTSRALTIRRTDTRSDTSMKQTWPDDSFYEYTGAQREKPLYFGRKNPRGDNGGNTKSAKWVFNRARPFT